MGGHWQRRYFDCQVQIAEGEYQRRYATEQALFEALEVIRAFVRAYASQGTYSDEGWALLSRGTAVLDGTWKWLFYDFNSPGEADGTVKCLHDRDFCERHHMPYHAELQPGEEVAVGDGTDQWLGRVDRIEGRWVYVRTDCSVYLDSLVRETAELQA